MIDIEETVCDTRKKIFTVAARLFAEKGYSAVSMREISEHAGLSKPTIYYYFGSKEGIYKELVTTGFSHIHSVLESTFSLNTTVSEKLSLILKKYFNFSQNFPEFTKFILNLICSAEKIDFLVNFKKEETQREQIIVTLFRDGIESGEFDKSLDPVTSTHIYMGVLMHFIMVQLTKNENVLSDQLADDILKILVNGMRRV